MGVRRYSRDHRERRWQERFDELQRDCYAFDASPTIGDLTGHGIKTARWVCRGPGWRHIGDPCWHQSAPFDLTRFGPKLRVYNLRGNYRCSECGRDRPHIELLPDR